MRLALKLVLAFILANATLAGVYGCLSVRREVDRFRKQAENEAQELGVALEVSLIDAWHKGDVRGMHECLAKIYNPQESFHIRLVLFDEDAEADFRPAAPARQWTAVFIQEKVELLLAADAEEAVAQIDAGQIQQVLTNLAMNAIQAMPNGGQVRFSVGRRAGRPPAESSGSPAAFYAIDVRDQGLGIPEEHLQQLFEPFFTTKEIGAGTGLGLSIAYGIVQEHGGWIDVASRVGEGSCFTVYLPQGASA
jgi:signal transduction histidine kinase